MEASRPVLPVVAIAEWAAAGALLLLAMLLTVEAGRGRILFSAPAWLDEYHTLWVAGRGSLRELLYSVANGGDYNPPLLHLIIRFLGRVTGGIDQQGLHIANLRAIAFASVWMALVFAYATLRRHFDRGPSFLATYSIWTHTLLLQHSFEIRFYGPWILFTLAYVWLLSRHYYSDRTWGSVSLACGAVALCTIHYFGLITWSLVTGAFVLVARGTLPDRIRLVAPSLVGPLALLACTPIYRAQRAVLSIATWIEPASFAETIRYLRFSWGFLPAILFAVLLLSLGRSLRQSLLDTSHQFLCMLRRPELASLLTLGAIPFVMIGFSLSVQPSMIGRYAITGLLMWLPVLAVAVQRVDARLRPFILMVVFSAGALTIRALAIDATETERTATTLARNLDVNVRAGDVVVIHDRFNLYPIVSTAPALKRATTVYPELADSMVRRAKAIVVLERDVARAHSRLFGVPRLMTVDALRMRPRFWLVDRNDTEEYAQRWFPEHHARRVAAQLFELALPDSSSGGAGGSADGGVTWRHGELFGG